MDRSYEEAIRCLNSRKAFANANLNGTRGSDDMAKWLQLLGHSDEDLKGLNAIHVAGTNGKGSTCAFAASFLQVHGNETGFPLKIGLYTSPHMRHIRERIRINGEPISKEQFTKQFFDMWDKLPAQATPNLDIPRYLQLLALLSFHVFITEKVEVAIFESHCGGEYDATNILKTPLVTAVTPISRDHVRLLGPTLKHIAWHKGGIFKSKSLAFSAPQDPAVAVVLRERATHKGVELKFVAVNSTLPKTTATLKPEAQRINCSLALEVVCAWLALMAPQAVTSKEDIITLGVDHFSWPGRYQQISDKNCQWFLDGAHNDLSLQYAVEWFARTITENERNNDATPRILIFSHFSDRDGVALLNTIIKSLQDNKIQMQHIIFSTYDERVDRQTRIDRNLQKRFLPDVQSKYAEVWKKFDPNASILCKRYIEDALHHARGIGDQSNGVQVLITGSLHLVSGALCLLDSDFL